MMILIDRVKQQCIKTVWLYRDMLPVKWAERSILVSEGLAVCAMCDLYGVKHLVESGTYYGRSALLFGNYDQGKLQIVTIDKHLHKQAEINLCMQQNVIKHQGDGNQAVLYFVKLKSSAKIGVFIDGPKGLRAVRLAQKCMAYPHVRFVGVHDCHKLSKGKDNVTRLAMQEAGAVWFTDAEWYVDAYRHLDKSEDAYDAEQKGGWKPGVKTVEGVEYNLGSYGPTIGFLMRDTNNA